MNQNRYSLLVLSTALIIGISACNDGRQSGADHNEQTSLDSNQTDTRRGATDTVNYLTKDSGNKSQETIDMNPPQNSRY